MDIWNDASVLLEGPVRLWHFLLIALAFGITMHNMQKQMSAIGKSVFDMWEKFHPYVND